VSTRPSRSNLSSVPQHGRFTVAIFERRDRRGFRGWVELPRRADAKRRRAPVDGETIADVKQKLRAALIDGLGLGPNAIQPVRTRPAVSDRVAPCASSKHRGDARREDGAPMSAS
jgi:hypothetical protein